MEGVQPDKHLERGRRRSRRRRANGRETPGLDRKNARTKGAPMTYNTPLPISGRDPDSVPLEERIAELEEAKRDPVKAIRAQRERRNREQMERDREDFKEAWLASGEIGRAHV